MKPGLPWGLVAEHHKGSSCHKTRDASVACCFYLQVYHLVLSTQPINQEKKRRKTCERKAVTLICSHTHSYEKTLIKSCAIYSHPDVRVENKAAALHVFTPATSRDCFYFRKKKENGTVSMPSSTYSVIRKEQQHNVSADQCILDFD